MASEPPGPNRASPLRVGLDITAAIVGFAGVSHYADSLWGALLEDPSVEIHAFGAGRGGATRFAARRLPVPLRVLHPWWRVAGWPRAETLAGEVEVVHSLDLTPAPTRLPIVMTIQDAFAVTHPELCAPRTREAQLEQLRAARDAAIIVTGCETTADLLAEVTGVSRERVVATPYGSRHVSPKPGVPVPDGEYILAVGAVTPRKGFELLARAANQVPGCPPVLLAGPSGWRGEEVMARIRDADAGDRVRWLGVVDDETLAALYSNATLVCQPSLAEGFGFSCLDAMGYGAPVVATDLPATRELGGGIATLVDPGSVEALAAAIERLLDDPGARHKMAVDGQRRCAPFTWQRTAVGTVEAYRRAVG